MISRQTTLWLATLAVVMAGVTGALPAQAASGCVAGRFLTTNLSGNYCPNNANCTGSFYPQSDYLSDQPIKDAIVQIEHDTLGVIGEGPTDTNGNYAVSWYVSGNIVRGNLRVRVTTLHKDGVFGLFNTAGQYPAYASGWASVSQGITCSNPQQMGTLLAPVNPYADPYMSTYWAAEKAYRESIAYSSWLASQFTGVQIRGFANTIAGFRGTCNTSCADGATKQIQLDANAMFQTQHRIIHEMGHIVSYLAQPRRINSNYCYNEASPCGWSQTSEEHGSVVFEEAAATFLADSTLWSSEAVNPTTCLTSGTCFDGSGTPFAGTNIETTSYPYTTNNCAAGEARWPLTGMRYFWDLYDTVVDADGDNVSQNTTGYGALLDIVSRYPAGLDQYQAEEPWDSSGNLDNNDGMGIASLASNYTSQFGNSVWLLRTDNCSSP